MISKDEVKHIAKLARVRLDAKEVVKFQKELSVILDYIAQLEEIDVSKVDLKRNLAETSNVTREDEAVPEPVERVARLLDLAPDKKDNYFKTKKIL